ncbi:MAG: aspartate kinase [Clostridiaceae bacterium]|jgi:aspartate kinase|nr:aspartate kinase [Bacillota bacterium]NLN51869.1 aspartate kinase [Clostridiaceae bacterium]
MKITKFGGSSCANAAQFKKVKSIISADNERQVVVVSAPGKRFAEDHKITDMLYLCHQLMEISLGGEEVFASIKERFMDIQHGLHLKIDLEPELDQVEQKLKTGASRDYTASRGEYFSAKLMAAYLGYEFIDAAEIIRFDQRGKYDEKATRDLVKERIKDCCFVVPGFYGAQEDGNIITFSRGGSDITGSILASALAAEKYENWTDVSGFLAADPSIVEDPIPLNTVTYDELRELSYMGAPVLHQEAIFPARQRGIPIHILNTNAPEDYGTLILPKAKRNSDDHIVTGIAGLKDFMIIDVEKYRMTEDVSFYRKLCSVFEANDIPIHHMPSSIDTISVIVREESIKGKERKILEEIDIYCSPDVIEITPGLSILAVVGENMAFRSGVSARVFGALADSDVNIRMISQGSSELNIIVGIANTDFERSIRAIYDEFFKVS